MVVRDLGSMVPLADTAPDWISAVAGSVGAAAALAPLVSRLYKKSSTGRHVGRTEVLPSGRIPLPSIASQKTVSLAGNVSDFVPANQGFLTTLGG